VRSFLYWFHPLAVQKASWVIWPTTWWYGHRYWFFLPAHIPFSPTGLCILSARQFMSFMCHFWCHFHWHFPPTLNPPRTPHIHTDSHAFFEGMTTQGTQPSEPSAPNGRLSYRQNVVFGPLQSMAYLNCNCLPGCSWVLRPTQLLFSLPPLLFHLMLPQIIAYISGFQHFSRLRIRCETQHQLVNLLVPAFPFVVQSNPSKLVVGLNGYNLAWCRRQKPHENIVYSDILSLQNGFGIPFCIAAGF